MPVIRCTKDGKPGYKVQNTEGCPHTYTPGSESSRKRAKQRAIIQESAIKRSQGATAGITLFTTIDEGHAHGFTPGELQTDEEDGHIHNVVDGEIMPGPDGHTHEFYCPIDCVGN